ncbi:tol-pal system protein YbgF [Solilutibacter silvestris]|uniref:Tol-pal system protein YbgF n=1 Tax=Solilutibacter silvestris TaxID=1645665 RepID=A0A2K1Q2T5_9GAMM|nr:tol-pal system protein YbgF [Lysobacter silvestris]PNS09358.1 tol-pal system protein YbgF [Lysobacter silvestris]
MRLAIPALWLALLLPAAPAFAQKASLAERVDALEAHAADDSAKLETLNQINALKEEIRGLRGQMEELQQQLNQQKEAARNQYLDIDGRLNRLEGGKPAATGGDQGANASPQPAEPAANAPAEMAPAASNGNDRADYDVAFKALKGGDYVTSSRGFKSFIDRWPKSALLPNARYWLGESYYATGNYALAAQQFKQVVDTYPTHPKAADAALKLRMSQQAMKQQKPLRKPAAR